MASPKVRVDTLGKIDINTLIALQIILTERSVSKAAADVGLSQPAMSNTLGRLREAFGDPLLVRAHGKMDLTTRGEEVLRQLDLILPQVERLAQPSEFVAERTTTTFNIASNDHALQILGPELANIVSHEAPYAKLIITTLQSRELDDESLNAYYDLRMGWFFSPPPSWFIRKLFEDEMVVIADRSCPIEGAVIPIEKLATLPHVGLRMHQTLDQTRMDGMLAERGMERHVSIWLSNFSSIPPLIARSKLIAMVPLTLAQRYERQGSVRILRLPVPLDPLRVSLAWSPTVHYQPANRWLRACIVHASRAYCDDQPEEGMDDAI